MNEQRYKKVGRRYVPVSIELEYEGWAPGSWLITISKQPHVKSYLAKEVSGVKPDKLALVAAAEAVKGGLETIVYEAMKLRTNYAMNKKQLAAWVALEKSGVNNVHQQSATSIAAQILDAIVQSSK